MDTSKMTASALSTEVGIKIGSETAPVKIIELINLRCPFCKKWFEDYNELLMQTVNNGKLQRIVKLYDKEKPGLDKGNIMHRYIPKNNGTDALNAIKKIYDTQDTWGDMDSFQSIATFAEEQLGLTPDISESYTETIRIEAEKAAIPFVPTMIVNEVIFDQTISEDDLKTLLKK